MEGMRMDYLKLSQIKNLGEGDERLIARFVLLLYSECLLENFKFGPEGNDFYWAIRDYLSGTCLPSTLKAKEEKVSELFPIARAVPRFNARSGAFLDKSDLASFLGNSKWRYDEEEGINSFVLAGKEYSWKSSFLKIAYENEAPYFLFYSNEEDGPCFRLRDQDRDRVYQKAKPYPFASKAALPSEGLDKARLSEEDFFKVEDLSRLAPEQKEAVRSATSTHTLILAGAGSGKTRCIVARVAYLNLVKGVPLSKIALITFTRNAAQVLKDRVKELYDNISLSLGIALDAEALQAQTIDSFVYRLARVHYKKLYMSREPRFSENVGSLDDVLSLCDRLITQQGTKGSIYAHYYDKEGNITRFVFNDMSKYFNGLTVNVAGIEGLANVYLNYEIEHCLFLDFSSLTYLFEQVLEVDEGDLKQAVLNDYEAILIDEFQDVSITQNKVFAPFYGESIHFTFVGDDDQTIYGWRGSDIEVIRRVKKLSNCKQYNLLTNYRSNASIVKAGNAILRIIQHRAKKEEPKALEDSPTPISVATYDDKFAELLPEVDNLQLSGVPLSEILILVRTNEEGKRVRDALVAHGTSVIFHGDAVDLDEVYWLFVSLTEMSLGAKPISLARPIQDFFGLKGVEHTEKRIEGILKGDLAPESEGEEQLRKFALVFNNPDDKSFYEVCLRFKDQYQQYLASFLDKGEGNELSRSRMLASEPMFEALEKDAKNNATPWPTSLDAIKSFFKTFENGVYSKPNGGGKAMDGVRIYTVHSAKGLEADYVFILGMGQGMMPNTSNIDRQRKLLKDQLYYIGQSRKKLAELKRDMSSDEVKDALRECDFAGMDASEAKWLRDFKKGVAPLSNGISRLSAEEVGQYNALYAAYIQSIERKLDDDAIRLRRECGRKIDELSSLAQRDQSNPSLINDSSLYGQLENEAKELRGRLEETESMKEAFRLGTPSIHSLYTKCTLAEAYYSDIEKEKSAEEAENLLDKMEAELKNEERRVFYVALTRAGKKLYLLHPEGSKESEFISLIPKELLSREELLSYKEIEKGRQAVEKTKERAAERQGRKQEKELVIHVEDEKMAKKLNAFLDAFYESHPKCRLLPKDARLYFENAVKWDCLGKVCSHEGAEYIVSVCLGKSARHLLNEKCFTQGVSALKMSEEDVQKLYVSLTGLPLKFPSPGLRSVEECFSKASFKDSLVGCAIVLSARAFGPFSSLSPQEFCLLPKEKALKLVSPSLDLANVESEIVYKDETEWKQRMLGLVFELYLDLVNELL